MDYELHRKGWFTAASRFADAIGPASNYPFAYIYAVFLTLSGHLIGRGSHIRYATNIYPNWYTCLIGDSGITHKSTAINLGLESLDSFVDEMHIIRALTTKQGLLREMEGIQDAGGEPKTLVVLDEIASMLQQKRKDFAADLLATIVELYSSPDFAGTYTRHDPLEVNHPFLSILSGTTIEWLRASLNSNDMAAGFGNRMSFVLGSPRQEKAWPGRPRWEHIDWSVIWQFEGEVRLDQNAMKLWEQWYKTFQTAQQKATPFVRVLSERIPEKILKTCIIECAWFDTHLVEAPLLAAAMDWGDYLTDCIAILAPTFEAVERQVLVTITSGTNTRPKLFGKLSASLPTDQIRSALKNLIWLGMLEEVDGVFRALKP